VANIPSVPRDKLNQLDVGRFLIAAIGWGVGLLLLSKYAILTFSFIANMGPYSSHKN
jgi:hypothetical protein